MPKALSCGRVAGVERSFSWFGRNRRLAKDFENLADTLLAFVTIASIQIALRRLARI
jgi:putative transposase